MDELDPVLELCGANVAVLEVLLALLVPHPVSSVVPKSNVVTLSEAMRILFFTKKPP